MSDSGPHPKKVHLAEQPVAVVRERVPMDALTAFFGRAFGTVMAAAQKQGAAPAGPPFALYRGIPGETVDVEAGFPMASSFRDADGVAAGTLPETDAFEALHIGPYDTLENTYNAVLGQMQAEGRVQPGVRTPDLAIDAEAYIAELGRRGIDIVRSGTAVA